MIKIIHASDLKTNAWSGGTTTELFIYPTSGDYKKLDFDFRISTATIEVESSTFSALPGVKRTLLVLDGMLELNHKDHHSTILAPLEADKFMGDWETTSGGKAVDFNLMIKSDQLNGNVKPLMLSKKNTLNLETERHGFVYVLKGDLILNETENLTRGSAIYFDESNSISIFAKTNSTIVFVLIS